MPFEPLLYQLTRDYRLPKHHIIPPDDSDLFLFEGFEVSLLGRLPGTPKDYSLVEFRLDGHYFQAHILSVLLEAVPAIPEPGPPAFARLGGDVWED